MKAFIDGVMGIFSNPALHRADHERLAHEMVRAFYAREYDSIDLLADRGARFTEEMLHVAISLQDARLIQRCIHAGIIPSEDMIRKTSATKNAALMSFVSEGTVMTRRHLRADALQGREHAAQYR